MEKESFNKDIYYTIAKKERAEIKIKGSKFIGTASYARTRQEALEFLEKMRSEFYNATHNCFAWRLGANGLEFRYSDDGEPNGTAGKPILFSIKKFDVSDIIIVVTRFFGGTKLGVGGLARAYSDSAEAVLELCEKKAVNITADIQIFCTYEDISIIKNLLEKFAVSYQETYRDAVEFCAQIPISKTDEFSALVVSATRARAGARKL